MLRLTILSTVCVVCLAQSQDNFRTFNFCRLENKPKCRKNAHPDQSGHPACNCTARDGRNVVEHSEGLRQVMLDTHNGYRNFIASGYANRLYVPSAADMMVLNWDFELEHIAKCRLLNSFYTTEKPLFNEPCSYTSRAENYGQATYVINATDTAIFLFEDAFDQWTRQIDNLDPRTIDSFKREQWGKQIVRFTQIVWSTTTHVGCAIVEDHSNGSFGAAVICNYKSVLLPFGGNLNYKPVYLRGTSCSICPYEFKCESPRYPALCGKTYPVEETPDSELMFEDMNDAGTFISVQQMDEEGGIEIVKGPIEACTSQRNALDWALVAACLSVLELVRYGS